MRKKLMVEEFDGVWGYSVREGMLDELVKEYKYGPVRGIGVVLAEFLDEAIPDDLGEVVVVPLSTVAKHVRKRGFDHAKYLAKRLARRRGWRYSSLLVRTNNATQVGATSAERIQQAKTAYGAKERRVEANKAYLLVDDVWTTGASMRAAAKELRRAGATKIYGAVVAVSGKV